MPATEVYLDTSVLVACFAPEPLSAVANRFVSGVEAPCLSPLTDVEFQSALARKVRARAMPPGEARAAAAQYEQQRAAGVFRQLAVTPSAWQRALGLVREGLAALATLDAVHLAVALEAGCVLVTADVELAEAAKAYRAPVKLLRPR